MIQGAILTEQVEDQGDVSRYHCFDNYLDLVLSEVDELTSVHPLIALQCHLQGTLDSKVPIDYILTCETTCSPTSIEYVKTNNPIYCTDSGRE